MSEDGLTKEDLKSMTALDFIDYIVAVCNEQGGEASIEFANAYLVMFLQEKETFPELTSQKYLM